LKSPAFSDTTLFQVTLRVTEFVPSLAQLTSGKITPVPRGTRLSHAERSRTYVLGSKHMKIYGRIFSK
jgi:hypothetical protein